VGEVADYQIYRESFMVRIDKNFKGSAKWTHKLQTEKT